MDGDSKTKVSTFYNVQSYIEGWLDKEGFSYDADEPEMIEILTLSLNLDVVEAYIKDTGILTELDRAASQVRTSN